MMSATETKRPYAQALEDAEAFRALFPPATYVRWEIAGSLRRRKSEVGDVEHVVIPAFGDVERGDGLFSTRERTNLLWFHLDSLMRGTAGLEKHWYGNGNRWGEKYRGVDYRGANHEIFIATVDNWGATLAIRTGPVEFSKRLVTGLLRNHRRNKDGQVWRCRDCPTVCPVGTEKCPDCDGTGLIPVEAISVPTEELYFELSGIGFVPPERRQ
jgi:DNA polymerase/3'-5' exonuclease PolX